MNPAELPLRDIHLPDPIGWWPPAPVWWIAATVVIVSIVFAVHVWRRRKAWRRSAIFIARGDFVQLRDSWLEHRDTQRLAAELSTWLRRVVISLKSRNQAAALTGAQWCGYLDELAGQPVFGHDGGLLLSEAPYRAAADIDPQRLVTLCEQWLDVLGNRVRQGRLA